MTPTPLSTSHLHARHRDGKASRWPQETVDAELVVGGTAFPVHSELLLRSSGLLRQAFKSCILPTPGAAIPTSGVARRERPPPPRITLRTTQPPPEVVPPPTPCGSPEGSPMAGAAGPQQWDGGGSGGGSGGWDGGSKEDEVAGLDEETLQLFLEYAYDPDAPVAEGGGELAVQGIRRLLEVAVLFQSEGLRAKCEAITGDLAAGQLEALNEQLKAGGPLASTRPASRRCICEAERQPLPASGTGSPPRWAPPAATVTAAAAAGSLLPALLSLAADFCLARLEWQCLPALCKWLAAGGNRRAQAGSLARLSGPAAKALALMLADLAGGLSGGEVAAWEYSEAEVEGLVAKFGGL